MLEVWCSVAAIHFLTRPLVFILHWVLQMPSPALRSTNYSICLHSCNHLLDQDTEHSQSRKLPPAPSQSVPPSGDCCSDSVTVGCPWTALRGNGTVCMPLLLTSFLLQCLDSPATLLGYQWLFICCCSVVVQRTSLCIYSPLDERLSFPIVVYE